MLKHKVLSFSEAEELEVGPSVGKTWSLKELLGKEAKKLVLALGLWIGEKKTKGICEKSKSEAYNWYKYTFSA